jgi:arginyl-tRNA synthetase
MRRHGPAEKVQVEFVSANPTGPLHVGHGRQAALGDAIAALLEAQGYSVTREFYYNDAGAQIEKLALSVQARARGIRPGDPGWPEEGYNGEYIEDIAKDFVADQGDAGDLEAVRKFAVAYLRAEQDADLQAFGVKFDVYFLESSLYTDGKVDQVVSRFVANGKDVRKGRRAVAAYDRLRRRQGPGGSQGRRQLHVLRAGRRVPRHQVAARIPARDRRTGDRSPQHRDARARRPAIARHRDSGRLSGLHPAQPGQGRSRRRRGADLEARGNLRDAARSDRLGGARRGALLSRVAQGGCGFRVRRRPCARKTDENPVYYVQYAHARVCSVLAQWGGDAARLQSVALTPLALERELALAQRIAEFPDIARVAAQELAPHSIAFYLRELAGEFHGYYNAERILVEDEPLREARLALSAAVRQTLANGLSLLGVRAPEKM